MNYAMTRLFPTKEHHLIFDSGSLSTSATVISFHTYLTTPSSPLLTSTNKKSKFKAKQVNTTHIEVLGLGWDRELGGTMLDEMIKEQLIEEFETKVLKGRKIEGKEKEKALAKVAKEAAKVKSVLSANSDSSVNVSCLFLCQTFDATGRLTLLSFDRPRSSPSSTTTTTAPASPGSSLSSLLRPLLTTRSTRSQSGTR
jgi:hypoxia up-regulated 1